MAIKGQALTVNFLAWDTDNNVGKTGDSANFTLRLIKDGGAAAAPDNAGSITEPDSTNLKGVYEIALTAAEMNANFVTLGGVSSTSNIVIHPLFILTEGGIKTLLEADTRFITTKTPYHLVWFAKGTTTDELLRKKALQAGGTNVTSVDHLVGRLTHTTST